MSSNFTVKRICEGCGNVFEARTTVTRFCSKLCNKHVYKKSLRGEKMASMDKVVAELEKKKEDDLSTKEFLSVKQAAKLLGASDKILYGMISAGKLRAVNLSQRKTVIYRHDINKLFTLPPPVPEPERVLIKEECYNMAEAQAFFNISEKALYEIIKRYGLKKKRFGKGVYVSKQALEAVFDQSN